MGLVKIKDPNSKEETFVAFSTGDVYLFGRPIPARGKEVFRTVPIGLRVCIDAKEIRLANSRQVRTLRLIRPIPGLRRLYINNYGEGEIGREERGRETEEDIRENVGKHGGWS